jgi:enterochelin esterase-like enzyme
MKWSLVPTSQCNATSWALRVCGLLPRGEDVLSCMHAGLNHPNIFEEIIAFSTADYISPMAQWINPVKFKFDEYPKFYMGAGKYETSIFNNNVEFFDKLKENEIQVKFKEFVSGHDSNVWRIEFLEYLENRFKK